MDFVYHTVHAATHHCSLSRLGLRLLYRLPARLSTNKPIIWTSRLPLTQDRQSISHAQTPLYPLLSLSLLPRVIRLQPLRCSASPHPQRSTSYLQASSPFQESTCPRVLQWAREPTSGQRGRWATGSWIDRMVYLFCWTHEGWEVLRLLWLLWRGYRGGEWS